MVPAGTYTTHTLHRTIEVHVIPQKFAEIAGWGGIRTIINLLNCIATIQLVKPEWWLLHSPPLVQWPGNPAVGGGSAYLRQKHSLGTISLVTMAHIGESLVGTSQSSTTQTISCSEDYCGMWKGNNSQRNIVDMEKNQQAQSDYYFWLWKKQINLDTQECSQNDLHSLVCCLSINSLFDVIAVNKSNQQKWCSDN